MNSCASFNRVQSAGQGPGNSESSSTATILLLGVGVLMYEPISYRSATDATDTCMMVEKSAMTDIDLRNLRQVIAFGQNARLMSSSTTSK